MEKQSEVPEVEEELDISDVPVDPVALLHFHAEDTKRMHGENFFSVWRKSDAS